MRNGDGNGNKNREGHDHYRHFHSKINILKIMTFTNQEIEEYVNGEYHLDAILLLRLLLRDKNISS